MTKRLSFAASTVLLALFTAPAFAQEVSDPGIGRSVPAPLAPQVPVGASLAPADTSVASLPGGIGGDSVAVPAGFVGPMLPGAGAPFMQVATTPAAPAVDTAALTRNRRIGERLQALQREVPLVYNPYVRGYIDYFTVRNPKYTRRMLERQNLYFPLFERKLAQYGMPPELRYLSVVESALNPKAASHAKAVGLWQFIPQAAADYRLVINSWKDERWDPEKATDAACRYLRNLNRAFGGDWELALAAYNCGPGNVRRAIKRAGGRANFWAIFPYLPQETRGYVPSFTAVVYAMNHAADYGIVPENVLLPITTDTVLVSGPFDIAKLSETLGLDPKALHDLNPELRRPLLPTAAANYALRIPADKRLAFSALSRTEIYAACRPAPAATVALAQDSAQAANKPTYKATRYVVRRGETLQRVALRNGCSIAQLRAWNHLKSRAVVHPGQGLVVWRAVKPTVPVLNPAPAAAPTDNTAVAAAISPVASPAAPAATGAATLPASVASAPVASVRADSDPVVAAAAPAKPNAPLAAVAGLSAAQLDSARAVGYTVQRGDNLFQIARVFGVSVRKVTEWNGLTKPQVQLGQTLVVRAAAAELGNASASIAARDEPAMLAQVPPGGELAGAEYVGTPKTANRARQRALAAAQVRARWAAATRQRVRAVHLVQPGDTLWDISRKRNVSVEQIRRLNRLTSDALRPGQRIVLS